MLQNHFSREAQSRKKRTIMRLVTFQTKLTDTTPRLGAWIDDDQIVDLTAVVPDMSQFFEQNCLADAQAYIERTDLSDVALPLLLMCNCSRHSHTPQACGISVYSKPTWTLLRGLPVKKFRLNGSNCPITIAAAQAHPLLLDTKPLSLGLTTPKNSTLNSNGVSISAKLGKNISVAEASEYIAGYTIYNDISARDIQFRHMTMALGPAKGKDFDNSNIMGPCLVTPDEISDPYNLRMIARVNGEVWADGNTSDMYYSFEEMISFVSQSETLYPGEFLGSGTVGKGCGWELDRWIQPGDVIELEVENIGVLSNQIGEIEVNPAEWTEKGLSRGRKYAT